jgi:rhodanese-related sulfurtransferase
MASQAFWDVEYESRSDSTEERIVAYSFKSTRQMIDRKPHQFQGRVAVEWLANPPLDALDLQAEIPFEIQIPDGTEVGVLGSSVIQYRIFQRRLEVLFNRELEPQIKQVNAVFRRSQSQLSRPLLISEDTAEESSWRSGWPKVGTTALCGVVSAFAVANYWDEATSIDTWISPDYVRSPKGSRIEDLEQAAKEHGLSTAGLSGLNVATLCSLDMPAILHIRSRVEAVAFDHWVVFFGVTKDGSYVILDPSHGVELISHAELAARFGGTSLLLAPDRGRLDVNIARFRNRAVLQAIIYSACFVLAAVAIHYLHGHFRKTYLLMVFGAMGLLALAFHSWNPDGFLRLTPSRTKLVAAFDQQEITKIGLLELQSLLESPGRNVILIYARFESEYSRGSLPNAINFPLDLTPQRQIQLIESLGHEDTIIVFCESAECPWSETIARRIAMYGYKKLMIYEGGHREWRNR